MRWWVRFALVFEALSISCDDPSQCSVTSYCSPNTNLCLARSQVSQSCNLVKPCLPSLDCVGGICKTRPLLGRVCQVSADCPSKQACNNRHICSVSCRIDLDCTSDQVCINKFCSPRSCTRDRECLSNQICGQDQTCRPKCLTYVHEDDPEFGQCTLPEICVRDRCVLPCATSVACNIGEVCSQGLCLKTCTFDQDCTYEGYVCENSICIPGCPATTCDGESDCKDLHCRRRCTATANCPAKQQCTSGLCLPTCSKDTDCYYTDVCEASICQRGCVTDTDCGSGKICNRARCEARCVSSLFSFLYCPLGQVCHPNGRCMAPCGGDRDCRAAEYCVNSRCMNASSYSGSIQCTTDYECPDSKFCESRKCISYRGVGDRCNPPNRCGAGLRCKLSVCRAANAYPVRTCTKSSDCLNIGGFCRSGMCKPFSDIYRPCNTTSPCFPGLLCEDRRCLGTNFSIFEIRTLFTDLNESAWSEHEDLLSDAYAFSILSALGLSTINQRLTSTPLTTTPRTAARSMSFGRPPMPRGTLTSAYDRGGLYVSMYLKSANTIANLQELLLGTDFKTMLQRYFHEDPLVLNTTIGPETAETLEQSCAFPCPAGYYQTGSCDSDVLQCSKCTVCGKFEFAQLGCSATANGMCAPCTRCSDSSQAQITACSTFVDTVCAPTPASGCNSCGVGTPVYESRPCTLTRGNTCSPCSPCADGQYVVRRCSASENVVCAKCTVCAPGFFASEPCRPLDTVCQPCTVCSPGQFALAPCTNSSDTVCSDSQCEEGDFFCSSGIRQSRDAIEGRPSCIVGSARCDGVLNCVKGEDEVACTHSPTTLNLCVSLRGPNAADWFPCEDGSTCIAPGFVCDGVQDCGDGSDETCNPTERPTPRPNSNPPSPIANPTPRPTAPTSKAPVRTPTPAPSPASAPASLQPTNAPSKAPNVPTCSKTNCADCRTAGCFWGVNTQTPVSRFCASTCQSVPDETVCYPPSGGVCELCDFFDPVTNECIQCDTIIDCPTCMALRCTWTLANSGEQLCVKSGVPTFGDTCPGCESNNNCVACINAGCSWVAGATCAADCPLTGPCTTRFPC